LELTAKLAPLAALWWALPPHLRPSTPLPDALAGRISRGIGTLATATTRNDL